jgi:hypothetical protein
VVGAAHLARIGTPVTRACAALAIASAAAVWAWLAWRGQRDWRDGERTLRRILVPTDRALGERALRALRTIDRAAADPAVGDSDLARLHFERLIGRASVDAVEGAALRYAHLWRGLGLGALLVALFVVFLSPLRLVEGLDVLGAYEGRAPVELSYLRYPRVTAQPPSYTRASERTLVLGASVALPKGTVITVRGMPRHEERALVVTDGTSDVPFVSDGAGGLVARYSVEGTTTIRIGARFGSVLIEEEDALRVHAIVDTVPAVVLDEAPKKIRLAEVERIALRWSAKDDYGLREVALVLRSGAHEDRRVLGKFDGESARERGGYSLSARDPFLRRAFLPVSLTVEARDNDPIDGSKWGRSEAIVVLPPTVGQPEGERYRALATIRDEVIALIGWYADPDVEGGPPEKEVRERVATIRERANDVLEGTYGGLSVPRGVQSFTLGQLGRLSVKQKAGTLDRFEDVALALDAGLRSFGVRDAEIVAKRLGDVTEEIATGARLARETEQRAEGLQRVDVALGALQEGLLWLARLGPLGRDLGNVAGGDSRRIARSRKADDLTHTELAALHLAARLRRPNPSFGSAGGIGGVETGSGGGKGSGGNTPSSEADRAFDQLADQIRQLAREHGDALSGVEQTLQQAREGQELGQLQEEARERARAVRAAVEELPARACCGRS